MEPHDARSDGTRERLLEAISCLQHLLASIYMPGDFAARARALIADMQDERRRRATADIDKRPSCSPTWHVAR